MTGWWLWNPRLMEFLYTYTTHALCHVEIVLRRRQFGWEKGRFQHLWQVTGTSLGVKAMLNFCWVTWDGVRALVNNPPMALDRVRSHWPVVQCRRLDRGICAEVRFYFRVNCMFFSYRYMPKISCVRYGFPLVTTKTDFTDTTTPIITTGSLYPSCDCLWVNSDRWRIAFCSWIGLCDFR